MKVECDPTKLRGDVRSASSRHLAHYACYDIDEPLCVRVDAGRRCARRSQSDASRYPSSARRGLLISLPFYLIMGFYLFRIENITQQVNFVDVFVIFLSKVHIF
jgi:hypothetical protein